MLLCCEVCGFVFVCIEVVSLIFFVPYPHNDPKDSALHIFDLRISKIKNGRFLQGVGEEIARAIFKTQSRINYSVPNVRLVT